MFGLPIGKVRNASKTLSSLKSFGLPEDDHLKLALIIFGGVILIASPAYRPDMQMGESIALWEYGLDDFYIADPVFRFAYDRYSREEPYAGFTFQQFLKRSGITLKAIRAAQKSANKYKKIK